MDKRKILNSRIVLNMKHLRFLHRDLGFPTDILFYSYCSITFPFTLGKNWGTNTNITGKQRTVPKNELFSMLVLNFSSKPRIASDILFYSRWLI